MPTTLVSNEEAQEGHSKQSSTAQRATRLPNQTNLVSKQNRSFLPSPLHQLHSFFSGRKTCLQVI